MNQHAFSCDSSHLSTATLGTKRALPGVTLWVTNLEGTSPRVMDLMGKQEGLCELFICECRTPLLPSITLR